MYSLRQLEAYTALSHSDQLSLRARAEERRAVRHTAYASADTLESKHTVLCAAIKAESTGDQAALGTVTEILQRAAVVHATPPKEVEPAAARRALVANQLSGAPTAKASPKAVTASVFRAIPTGAKPFKALPGSAADSVGISPAAQSVTASLIQPIAGASSAQPRPASVTASLFQPRTVSVSQLPSRAETMNKSFCMLADDLCQPNCEYTISGCGGKCRASTSVAGQTVCGTPGTGHLACD